MPILQAFDHGPQESRTTHWGGKRPEGEASPQEILGNGRYLEKIRDFGAFKRFFAFLIPSWNLQLFEYLRRPNQKHTV